MKRAEISSDWLYRCKLLPVRSVRIGELKEQTIKPWWMDGWCSMLCPMKGDNQIDDDDVVVVNALIHRFDW
jgi:hypothetical protein